MNENTEGSKFISCVRRKRASVTPHNRNRTVINGTSLGQRKLCAIEDGDEGGLPKDYTPPCLKTGVTLGSHRVMTWMAWASVVIIKSCLKFSQ